MSQGPPYRITPEMLSRVVQIGEAIGRAEAAGVSQDLHLRRINRIRTIQGSLAIEGNILNEEQISTILDGKPVVAPLRDIQEARNAIKAYDRYEQWNAASEADLLTAHQILMAGLVDAPGRYRRAGVAVMGQGRVHHVGPPAERVPQLMADLLAWLGTGRELDPRQPERVLQCHSGEFRPRREHAVHCLYAGGHLRCTSVIRLDRSGRRPGNRSAYSGSTVTSLIATCDSSRMLLTT